MDAAKKATAEQQQQEVRSRPFHNFFFTIRARTTCTHAHMHTFTHRPYPMTPKPQHFQAAARVPLDATTERDRLLSEFEERRRCVWLVGVGGDACVRQRHRDRDRVMWTGALCQKGI